MRDQRVTDENIAIGEFVEFAQKLADTSGEIISQYFRQNKEVSIKKDFSPVTIADKEAEKALRIMIQEEYPTHGLVGEEFGVKNEEAEYKWVIDPIDGTQSFMIGRPIFGTLISLVYKISPILGIIDQPITKERWIGVPGEFISYNGKAVQTTKNKALKEAVLCTTGPGYFNNHDLAIFATISNAARYTIYGGDCYNYGLLASGFVDIVIESGLKPHDFCALVAVVEAAGGIVTDWQGNPITMHSEGQIIASANKKIHSEVLELISNKTEL